MGFRENLKSQLDYSGIQVKELAFRSGVNKRTIDSYLSSREYKPSAEAAVNIAKALGVSVEYLVTGGNAIKDMPISSLHEDLQEILHASKQLNAKDRQVIISLARFLRER